LILSEGTTSLREPIADVLQLPTALSRPSNSFISSRNKLPHDSATEGMWRNNNKQTGANDAPLTTQRRWGGGVGNDSGNPQQGGPPPSQNGYGGGFGGGQQGPGGYAGGFQQQQQQQGGYGGENRGPGSFGGGPPRGYGQQSPPGGGYGQQQQQQGYGGGYEEPRGRPQSRFDDRGPPGLPSAPPPPPPAAPAEEAAPGERKRKSRWGSKQENAAMPVAITGGVQEKDLEAYACESRFFLYLSGLSLTSKNSYSTITSR